LTDGAGSYLVRFSSSDGGAFTLVRNVGQGRRLVRSTQLIDDCLSSGRLENIRIRQAAGPGNGFFLDNGQSYESLVPLISGTDRYDSPILTLALQILHDR